MNISRLRWPAKVMLDARLLLASLLLLAIAAACAGDGDDRGLMTPSFTPDGATSRVEPSPERTPPEPMSSGSMLSEPTPSELAPSEPTPPDPSPSGPVLYVDPAGDDAAEGSSDKPLRTIQQALMLAQPGTTVRLRTGVYFEAVETVRPGRPTEPIILEADSGNRPVIDGQDGELNGPRLVHSYVTLRRVEIRNTQEGVRIEHAEGVVLADNVIHHIRNECVRLRFFARNNRVERNLIHDCGLGDNGEGIYVGTAPEQRAKNGGLPDTSTDNHIAGNKVFNVTEGIDIKEDASRTTVVENLVYAATDPNSGAINIRSDDNFILNNRAIASKGAGFRFGGDIADSPTYGGQHAYGVGNLLRQNVAERNEGQGFKFMRGPQVADCTNTGAGNGGLLFYFKADMSPFLTCP